MRRCKPHHFEASTVSFAQRQAGLRGKNVVPEIKAKPLECKASAYKLNYLFSLLFSHCELVTMALKICFYSLSCVKKSFFSFLPPLFICIHTKKKILLSIPSKYILDMLFTNNGSNST